MFIFKNLTRIAIAGLVGSLLAACSSSEVRQQPQEVSLRPMTAVLAAGSLTDDPATKADPELGGTTLGTDHTYVVYLSASCDQQPKFMEGQLYSYISATTNWRASSAPGTADPVYWPAAEKLDFLGLACKPAAYTALAPAWDATTSADAVTITGWDVYANQYDVMYASSNQQAQTTNAGVVDMEFRHTCALICFTAESTIADAFTINGITIKGLTYEGDLTVDNSRTSLAATWSNFSAPADKLAYNLSGNLDDYAFSVPTHLDSSDPGYVAGYDQCCQHLLVPPQAAKSLVLTYTTRGAATSLDYTIRLPRTVWKAGYKYTYALKITPTEIIADPSVSAWDGSAVVVNL